VHFTVVVPQIPCCLDKEKPSDVPRGEVMGVQTPVESSICFSIVYAQKHCPSSAPVFMKFKNFVQVNVKIRTLFSHFASIYWLCPWTELRDFCGWWRGSVVRASVFDWRTLPVMRLIYG